MDVNRCSDCIECNLSFKSMMEFYKRTPTGEAQKRTRDIIMDLDETGTKLGTGTKP